MKQVSVYEQALRLLEFRARTVVEMRRKLALKGAPATDIAEVIARLCDQKLLNDADFARQFARTRIVGAGASRYRIVQELRRKGIDKAIAEEAVERLEESEGINASATIHRVAGKKWKALAKLDDFTRRRRLYAFLARRGYNPDEIRIALDALNAEVLEL
jgi:regulatory protein